MFKVGLDLGYGYVNSNIPAQYSNAVLVFYKVLQKLFSFLLLKIYKKLKSVPATTAGIKGIFALNLRRAREYRRKIKEENKRISHILKPA